MDIAAKVTSKGQITIPQQVRDALNITTGDEVIFRVERNHAVMARTPNLLDLAGAVEVPTGKLGVDWDDIQAAARRSRSGTPE